MLRQFLFNFRLKVIFKNQQKKKKSHFAILA